MFFEAGLARRAARHATAEDLDALAEALEVNRRSIGDLDALRQTDVDFRHTLAAIARNPIFEAVHAALAGWLLEQRRRTLAARPAGLDLRRRVPRFAADELPARDPRPRGGAGRRSRRRPAGARAGARARHGADGQPVLLGLRPEHLGGAEGPSPRPGRARHAATVEMVQPTGSRSYATVRPGRRRVARPRRQRPQASRSRSTSAPPGPRSSTARPNAPCEANGVNLAGVHA
ncbi:FCD domain-containing protein [Amaricoccus sp.]|uniref:FCD domain-containing protein n=1 Tax=Amaricoccus sp. TaxID=1872485 RepID=UPI001B612F10|nr:FCD domain-containing protein [Amaricoccus sp.]MBP7002136.1 FCD domain-containing protein [Amaricoccus sp.]